MRHLGELQWASCDAGQRLSRGRSAWPDPGDGCGGAGETDEWRVQKSRVVVGHVGRSQCPYSQSAMRDRFLPLAAGAVTVAVASRALGGDSSSAAALGIELHGFS